MLQSAPAMWPGRLSRKCIVTISRGRDGAHGDVQAEVEHRRETLKTAQLWADYEAREEPEGVRRLRAKYQS
jgi:hypothetical protein